MWSLFNLDDTKSLRISDLVQGVTSVCQLDNQEFFDFYPAVRFEQLFEHEMINSIKCRAAFKYAKIFSGEEELGANEKPEAAKQEAPGTIVKSKVEPTLNFEEFRIFFFAMRQYLIYCQVCILKEIGYLAIVFLDV